MISSARLTHYSRQRQTIREELERRRINVGVSTDIESSKDRCKTLAGFIKEAWSVIRPVTTSAGGQIVETTYVHGWHIDLLCAHLEAITFGKFLERGLDNRLLANVPPGTMKSLTTGVFWQAWEWGPCDMPHIQCMNTSFREDNCYRDARRFRTLVTSEWYQKRWGDRVRITIAAEGHVENDRSGWRKTMPFKSLTGERSDRLNIDDPHSIDTAESDTDRARAELTFRESATTRLNDPVRSAILLIMQRLHENDLTGVAIRLKMPYVHLMLPMRFEPERACVTPFGRDIRTRDGELLFPERFPEHVVDRDEAAMGAHAVAGQHQQRPSPRGGLMFKRHWFDIVGAAPADCRWVRGWDLAGSVKKTSAYTAGVLVGQSRGNKRFYIADVVRDRVSNPQPMLVNTATQDGKDVEISIPQDPGAAGLIQAKAHVSALVGYRVQATPESGEKVDRARPVADQAEVGNVSIVEGDWNDDFLAELVKFPAGAYKDQVDALSRAFSKFILSKSVVMVGPVVITKQVVPHGTHEGFQ